MRIRNLIAASGVLLLILILGCITEGRQAGRGSEVENEVYGTLVDASGKPVQGARVKALPAAAAADTDSVVTDSRGRYAFDSLPAGTYNLLGDYRSSVLVVLIPGVDIADSGRNLGTDTLRAPGAVRGRFRAGSKGKAGVLASVAGLSKLELSDDSGWFQISGIPQGRYSLRYSAPGFIIPQDTGVVVKSGQVTELPDKNLEYDPALNPPEPVGLKARYDTLNEQVILSWEAVPVSDLDGFIIYRDDPASLEPAVVPGGFTKATTFIDSSFPGASDPGGRDLVYRLKSRDLKLNRSLNFSDPAQVRVVSRSLVTTAIRIAVSGLRSGAASPGDTLLLVAEYRNPGRKIREIAWSADNDPAVSRTVMAEAGEGADTLMWIAGGPGTAGFSVRMRDDAGYLWHAETRFGIILDPPRAFAGADREVSIGDSIVLTGSGTDGFGSIRRLEWSIGGAPFSDAPGGAVAFRAPASPAAIPCILRVTDDDGNTASDSMVLDIVRDPPVVSAGKDTTISVGDRVYLHASASDKYGQIASWEWGIDGADFHQGRQDTAIEAPLQPDPNYRAVARVTDDDGNEVSDTVFITVVPDPPSADAGSDTVVSVGDTVIIRGRGVDGFGKIERYGWDIGGTGTFIDGPSERIFVVPSGPIAHYPCVLKVTDDDGMTGVDTLLVAVVADPPLIRAYGDTTVSIGDTVFLKGTGTDRFGAIKEWKWSCGGDAPFFGQLAKVKVPNSPDPDWKCLLSATDDDGQIGVDTVSIHVVQDPPFASISSSVGSDAFVGDTVTLSGSSSRDGFGAIVKYEWNIGGTGFRASVGYDTVIRLPSSAGTAVECVLRVTDDDGNQSNDSLTIVAHPKGLSEWFRSDGSGAFASVRDPALISFKGRMVMLGGRVIGNTYSSEVWGSSDGLSWERLSSQAEFGPRSGALSAIFQGKAWIFGGEGGSGRLNDAWNSEDGVHWARVSSAMLPEPWYGGRLVATANGLILITAYETDSVFQARSHSEVWSSRDGVTWNKVAASPEFGDLQGFGAYTAGGKLWLNGGMRLVKSGFDFVARSFDGVWRSDDGSSWIKEPSAGPAGYQGCYIQQNATVFRLGGGGAGYSNDVAWTTSGSAWVSVPAQSSFPEVSGAVCAELSGRLWIIGGYHALSRFDGSGEIWYSK